MLKGQGLRGGRSGMRDGLDAHGGGHGRCLNIVGLLVVLLRSLNPRFAHIIAQRAHRSVAPGMPGSNGGPVDVKGRDGSGKEGVTGDETSRGVDLLWTPIHPSTIVLCSYGAPLERVVCATIYRPKKGPPMPKPLRSLLVSYRRRS